MPPSSFRTATGPVSTPLEAPAHPPRLGDALRRLDFVDPIHEPLAGDVSPRRYVRLREGRRTVIVAYYPAELAGTAERFLATTHLLEAVGVRVPAVLAAEPSEGWILLEDLGHRTLFEERDPRRRRRGIRTAAELPARLQALDLATVSALNPPLDAPQLRRELARTETAVLDPLALDASERAAWSAALDTLCARIAGIPAAPTHRDLMARNLLFDRQGRLAVLDHQDLRLAPAVYDLASLLNDSLFASVRLERELVPSRLPVGCTLTDYHRVAVQRTLKAIGTFVTFARAGAPRHLPLVAPTLAAALRHLRELPEDAALYALLAPLAARIPRWPGACVSGC